MTAVDTGESTGRMIEALADHVCRLEDENERLRRRPTRAQFSELWDAMRLAKVSKHVGGRLARRRGRAARQARSR